MGCFICGNAKINHLNGTFFWGMYRYEVDKYEHNKDFVFAFYFRSASG